MADKNGHKPNILERALAPTVERAIVAGMEQAQQERVSELIGRGVIGTAQVNIFKSRARAITVDETVPDYEFYDRLRRGKARGYTLGGLFAKRIENIFASWVLGDGAEVKLDESGARDDDDDPRNVTDAELAKFINREHAGLMQVYKDHMGLGDQYIIVNPDGSLSVPSPDTVEVTRSKLDYRDVQAVEVTTKLKDVTIIDRYTAMERTITIKERRGNGAMSETTLQFENLINRIPVVHLAHDRSANETNGHPIHEELLPLYDQYDDTIYKQLDGAKLLGNPILAIWGLEDLDAVVDANKPAEYDTYLDKDGNKVTHKQLDIDSNSLMLIGKGGQGGFLSPPTGFTDDTARALKTLFLLLLDHTGIPEFIWGNQISSGRSSSEVQLKQFVRDIQGRQKADESWLLELCEIWLLLRALVDPRIVVDELAATWPPLIEEDDETQLKKLTFAKDRNLMTDKTTLALLHLVDDPEAEVQDAQAEADERREAMFPDGDSTMFQQRLFEDEGETE